MIPILNKLAFYFLRNLSNTRCKKPSCISSPFPYKIASFLPSQIGHPTAQKAAQTPFRSMIWVAKSQNVQQVSIHYLDITAILLFHLE